MREAQKNTKVLVVDDERLVADTLVEILTHNGFDTAVAYDGRAALESARGACPDILLSDVIMPEMNGIEAAKWVKDHCPNTRIVLFSGQSAASNLLDRARAQGYDFELLSKPIHPNLLLQRLRNSPR